jgi:hypothetical protein
VLKPVLEGLSPQVLAYQFQPGRLACLALTGMQRSVPEWAIRQGWWRRPVRLEEVPGIPFAALGMLATHFGSEKAV